MVTTRLAKYLDFKGIPVYKFEDKLGTGRGTLSKSIKENRNLGSNVLENCLNACEDLNPEWLLTGRGSMLRDTTAAGQEVPPAVATICPICQAKDLTITTLQAHLKDKDTLLAAKDATIHDKDTIIAAKDTIIAARDKEIHCLSSSLSTQKKEVTNAAPSNIPNPAAESPSV